MSNIKSKINNLPNELQDHIYGYYWSYNFYKVLDEIKNIFLLDDKINNFISKYGNNVIKQNNNYYYKKFNTLIKKITHNKGKMLLCKYNNLSLKYCNINYIDKICSDIKNDYKYIAPILVSKSNYLRYQVFYYLKSL